MDPVLPTASTDGRTAGTPQVSVVMATYNRSNVLRYAIQSVLDQSFADWELLVIGDACTDDTADVVASFSDPRIRFVNLATNAGEQSVPNNEGVRLSRGRYIAFLNHDDLWLPHHLSQLTAALERTGADLVFSLASLIQPDGTSWLGSVCVGRPDDQTTAPASTWLFRRELAGSVGPWRYYRDCYRPPSQDWLQRARRAGRILHGEPRLSVLAIQSAVRPGCYGDRQEVEHQRVSERLRTEPDFLERELTTIALTHAIVDPRLGISLAVRLYAQRAWRNLVRRAIAAIGFDPTLVRLASRRRGAAIDDYRRRRGLPFNPRPRPDTRG
jgi:glycosyltransferase involved in cell wall biosynthesis